MVSRIDHLLQSTFEIKENEGANKVISLAEAIRRNVKPGMAIYVGECANAAVCEIIRQYWGTRAKFTLIALATSGYEIGLIYGGLVEKVITSAVSDMYPATRANPLVQKAYQEKGVKFENWSLYSLTQRLMAGALGLPFMPTRSIIGSSMAEENRDYFQKIADPFGGGKAVPVVKALKPDVALVHGWAADPDGNTILGMAPVSGEGAWGALASEKGVVVTIEKVVSTHFIREHSARVQIPGYMVKSVSQVPFGAHPYGFFNYGMPEFESYGPDYESMLEYQQASKAPQDFEKWIEEWILDCPGQEDYLRKLGEKRIALLKAKAKKDFWKEDLEACLNNTPRSEECNATERMVVAAARRIKETVREKGYKAILAGIGAAALAAAAAYYQLRKEGYIVELIMGSGWYGYAPRPGDPWLFAPPHILSCKMIGEVVDAYGVWVGADNQCLTVLGAAQIDKHGNINSTKIPPNLYLIGSGGSNDASNAHEVIVIAPQSSKRFVEKVAYITCPGDRVKTLVSNQGVFQKLGEEGEFVLTGYLSDSQPSSPQSKIQKVKQNCGWDLKVLPDAEEITSPSLEELMILRILDPRGLFIGD